MKSVTQEKNEGRRESGVQETGQVLEVSTREVEEEVQKEV